MSQTVLQLTNDQIHKMMQYYQKFIKDKLPPGSLFAAKTSNCSITAYKSGKVLFQGQGHELEAGRWGKPVESKKKTSSQPKIHKLNPPKELFEQEHGGSDEAGTGDYFGPITVVCAYITKEQIPQLRQIGVQDSKNLKDDKILSIAKGIIDLKVPYSLITLKNEKYNQLQQKGWTQGKMKTMLHHTAINNVVEKVAPAKPNGFIIDQFAEPSVYERHLRTEKAKLQENVYFMTKAESYSLAVATASILARAAFVKQMDKLSVELGMPLPKGASSKVDEAAANIIKKHGIETLDKYAKVHFANTDKAKKGFH